MIRGLLTILLAASAIGAEITGPSDWQTVNTNAVEAWCSAHAAKRSAKYLVERGVATDLEKREVRVLAEAVGHREGITTEFMLVGPLSDRAYESTAISVAKPSDICKGIEALGIKRGGPTGSEPFRFWPIGERFSVSVVLLENQDAKEQPLAYLLNDKIPEEPIVGPAGFVYTGGLWKDGCCQADTNMPSSIIAVYNEPSTIFDVPYRFGQSEVYGRITTSRKLKCGELLEFVFRPLMPADGKPRVKEIRVEIEKPGDGFSVVVKGATEEQLFKGSLQELVPWMKGESEAGRELFVKVKFADSIKVSEAAEAANLFLMLDGKGIKLDGKVPGGLYPKAYLPDDQWREIEDRVPQPFELHIKRAENGKFEKKLRFIEEDWNVEGIDPKLTPKDYPFEKWEELPALVQKAGGSDNKVTILFVFALGDMTLGEVMPGVEAVSKRLNLVYIFKNL